MEYPVCYHNTLPHVANAAKFDAVRYFYNEIHKIENVRQTKVKDFKKGLSSISVKDQKFYINI